MSDKRHSVLTLYTALFLAAGIGLAAPAPKAQAATCPKPKLTLQYDIKAEQPILSHKLSLDVMQTYKKQALIGHQGPNWQLRGFHKRRATSDYRWRNQNQRIGNNDCLVGMTFRFNYRLQHAIHIAKDYPKGSCEYDVIFAHEKQHAKYEMHVLRKNEDRLRALVRQTVVKNIYQSPKRLEAAVDRSLQVFWAFADRKAAKLHSKIDTPENYAREAAKCGNW